jgi:hypothetical protein
MSKVNLALDNFGSGCARPPTARRRGKTVRASWLRVAIPLWLREQRGEAPALRKLPRATDTRLQALSAAWQTILESGDLPCSESSLFGSLSLGRGEGALRHWKAILQFLLKVVKALLNDDKLPRQPPKGRRSAENRAGSNRETKREPRLRRASAGASACKTKEFPARRSFAAPGISRLATPASSDGTAGLLADYCRTWIVGVVSQFCIR